MQGFQKTVLIIACVVLLITLIIMALLLRSNSGENWPPSVPVCPDWWVSEGSGDKSMCINVKDLGICPAQQGKKHQIMNFNSDNFTGDNGDCAKYTWANKCKVSWDGITYGVDSPCATTS